MKKPPTDKRNEDKPTRETDSGSSDEQGIPEQLAHEPLIRLKKGSKVPVKSSYAVEAVDTIHTWLEEGGNVGVALLDDLVVLDVDEIELHWVADKKLPSTFIVNTGGGGEHRYFRCPEWEDNRKLGPLGSIRSQGWQVAAPPSIHPSGSRYRVQRDEPISDIQPSKLEELAESFNGEDCQHSPAPPSCVGGSVSGSYPNRVASTRTLEAWLESNGLLDALDHTGEPDRSGHEFTLAKCLAEGGFAKDAIASVLDQLPSESKWHKRGEQYREQTVLNAIQAAVDDPYVNYGEAGDMESIDSESRKTEEARPTGLLQGGKNMVEYTDHEEAIVYKGDDDGDQFVKIARTTREDDGDTREYVSIKKGILVSATYEGEEVLAEQVTDSLSIGSVDQAPNLSDASEEFAELVTDTSSGDGLDFTEE